MEYGPEDSDLCLLPSASSTPNSNIVITKQMKYKKLRSTYYTKSNKGLQCKTCDKYFSIKTSHSTLKTHLQSHEGCSEHTTKLTKKSYYDRLVLNFIIYRQHPFSVVQETHFKKLLQRLNPSHSVVGPITLNLNIQELFKQTQTAVKET